MTGLSESPAITCLISGIKKDRLKNRGLLSLLTVLVHILRHLKMVLQGGQCFAGPILELRIIAALGIALEERSRILMRAHSREARTQDE
jgi:hypothetical protein